MNKVLILFLILAGVRGRARLWGDGRECLDLWQHSANGAGYVLVCPSLADDSGGWSTDDGEKKLRLILDDVPSRVNLLTKVSRAGFSAGAEFARCSAMTFRIGWRGRRCFLQVTTWSRLHK